MYKYGNVERSIEITIIHEERDSLNRRLTEWITTRESE